MSGKAFLRRLIVASSVPPVTPLYRAIYRSLVVLAVYRLRKFKGIRAIYLRRGLASSEWIPGISDIDLAAVGDWSDDACRRVTESYQQLARACPLYDPSCGVYTPQSLERIFATDVFLRHRFAEGQRRWKLLYGEDCLHSLGALTAEQARAGYESELHVWWMYFARWAYSPHEDRSDELFLNSLCFKAVTECVRMQTGLHGLPVPDSRREALSAHPSVFVDRLSASAARRFLKYDGDIIQDTQDFLIPLLDECYRPVAQREADAPETERLHREAELLDAARAELDTQWAGVTMIRDLAFAMDEIVLAFEPASCRVPHASELRRVAARVSQKLRHRNSRVSFYLRLHNTALRFFASDQLQGWQSILTEPDSDFVRLELQLLAAALREPSVYKANDLDFLRMVWKFLELLVAERSFAAGEPRLPQTPEAVLRALSRLDIPLAPFLDDFATAYRSALAGAPAGIGRHVSDAVEYLRSLADTLALI